MGQQVAQLHDRYVMMMMLILMMTMMKNYSAVVGVCMVPCLTARYVDSSKLTMGNSSVPRI